MCIINRKDKQYIRNYQIFYQLFLLLINLTHLFSLFWCYTPTLNILKYSERVGVYSNIYTTSEGVEVFL